MVIPPCFWLPVPLLGTLFFPPNIQSKLPLEQIDPISSQPATCCLEEETKALLATPSFQGAVKVSLEPVFLQTKQLFQSQKTAKKPKYLIFFKKTTTINILPHY